MKSKIFLIATCLTACATTDPTVREWRMAVLNERSETLKCIREICDNKMTVDHCLSLAESICK